MKITKTKCGTSSGDAHEGELFITPATSSTTTNEQLTNNNSTNNNNIGDNEGSSSPYIDGNYYSLCLDTSVSPAISLKLSKQNYGTQYMMRKTSNNILSPGGNDDYDVLYTNQYIIELSCNFYLFI